MPRFNAGGAKDRRCWRPSRLSNFEDNNFFFLLFPFVVHPFSIPLLFYHCQYYLFPEIAIAIENYDISFGSQKGYYQTGDLSRREEAKTVELSSILVGFRRIESIASPGPIKRYSSYFIQQSSWSEKMDEWGKLVVVFVIVFRSKWSASFHRVSPVGLRVELLRKSLWRYTKCTISEKFLIRFSLVYNIIRFVSIAFKPAESGWGSGQKYASNFDTIFGGSKTKATTTEETSEKIMSSKETATKSKS